MKTLKTLMLALFVLPLMTVNSCTTSVQTSSDPVIRELNHISFQSLEISSNFTVKLTPAEECKVKINVSERLAPNLIAKVTGDKLTLAIESDNNPSYNQKNKATVEISAPYFKNLDLAGDVKMTVEGDWKLENAQWNLSGSAELTTDSHTLNINQLNICQSGSSHIHAALHVKDLNINNAGSSHLTLQNLNQESGRTANLNVCGSSHIDLGKSSFEKININASGSADVIVFPVKKLNVKAAGSSSVRYVGSSKVLNKNSKTYGSASITQY